MLGKLNNIELKVKQLALNVERLRAENDGLRRDNEVLNREIDRIQKDTVLPIQEQLEKTQRLVDEQRGRDPEKLQKLRADLDQYIQEIDTCIAWLERQ